MRSTIFGAHEREGVADVSTVALRSSSGLTYPLDRHPGPRPGPGRGPEPRRPDAAVMSLALEQRYQASESDLLQRLADYQATRDGRLAHGGGI